jgi:integrase/recombinase XerC
MASGSIIRYAGKRGVVFRIKYLDASGKQCMETVGAERDGMSEKRAREILENRRVAVREGGYSKAEAFSFADAAEAWFNSERVARAWKPGTIGQYRRSREILGDYFCCSVAAIDSGRITAYRDWALAEGGLSPATVSRHLTVLNLILGWAADNGHLQRKPTVKYPRVRSRKGVALKPAQVQALLRSFEDEQARTAFLTFVTTGLRSSELRALRWRDVDLIENRLRVVDSKTETGARSIAIGKALAEALWQHRRTSAFQGEDEYVFCHPELGNRYRADRFAEALAAAFKAAGIERPEGFRRCHDLRVTCGTNDVQAGMDNARLQAKLGHSDFRTTQRYVNLAGVVFADEAEALERRLLAVEPSTNLTASESTEAQVPAWREAESSLAD